jgi:PPOX class probable F420-dependent enzyme
MLNEAARELIESGRVGHFTTLNPDGSPQTTCIWPGMDGDTIVIASIPENAKVKNVRRDGRVSLSIQGEGTTHGLTNYLVIEGQAEVIVGGAFEWLQHLAPRYLGPDSGFPAESMRAPGHRIVITPLKVRGNGPWS